MPVDVFFCVHTTGCCFEKREKFESDELVFSTLLERERMTFKADSDLIIALIFEEKGLQCL